MVSITDLIAATTEDEYQAARKALAERNAAAPTDAEVLAEFLAAHLTLDGKSLTAAPCND